MTKNGRILALIGGVGSVAGGGALLAASQGGAVPLLGLGVVLLASLGWEGRYGRQGKQKSIPHSRWELTGERFHDDETGEPVEVWIDPLTGERRYEPLGDHPRISDKRTHR